eukprot:scaffold1828_cov258-Pinguiococcus_pyrenoidosus.AAC.10
MMLRFRSIALENRGSSDLVETREATFKALLAAKRGRLNTSLYPGGPYLDPMMPRTLSTQILTEARHLECH